MALSRGLRLDESGAFPVFEAILVAVIVLTSILFFTSVQRPTTGSDLGGIDLAQTSADTLAILQSRTFQDMSLETWVTHVASGNDTTGSVSGDVDKFLKQILPTGARYTLRLDNGVSTMQILPVGTNPVPHAARASQITLFPSGWAALRAQAANATHTVYPGQVLATGNASLPLVDLSSTFQCVRAPTGRMVLPDLGDADAAPDSWRAHWNATPASPGNLTAPVVWKAWQNQVPLDVPYGTWAFHASTDCSGAATYVNVVRPSCISTPTASACRSPFVPYGLQLVVWFGA
jgi:hypothetical protein